MVGSDSIVMNLVLLEGNLLPVSRRVPPRVLFQEAKHRETGFLEQSHVQF